MTNWQRIEIQGRECCVRWREGRLEVDGYDPVAERAACLLVGDEMPLLDVFLAILHRRARSRRGLGRMLADYRRFTLALEGPSWGRCLLGDRWLNRLRLVRYGLGAVELAQVVEVESALHDLRGRAAGVEYVSGRLGPELVRWLLSSRYAGELAASRARPATHTLSWRPVGRLRAGWRALTRGVELAARLLLSGHHGGGRVPGSLPASPR